MVRNGQPRGTPAPAPLTVPPHRLCIHNAPGGDAPVAARAYGRAMDTFCGCDTAALDDLSSMVGERAAHLGAVMEGVAQVRSEEHTSELQSRGHLVCRLLLEK